MKSCFKCNIAQPLSSFYAHSAMKDGRLNKCISCTKNDVNVRYSHLKQDSEWMTRERERHRMKYYRLNYRETPVNPDVKRLSAKMYMFRYPEKYNAKKAACRIERQKGCHMHHWSYRPEHWKDVIELPINVHYLIHRHLSYDQTFKQYRDKDGNLLDSREKHEQFINSLTANA